MKILIINEVLGYTSTGRICAEIAEQYMQEGHEVRVAYGRWGQIPEEYRNIGVRIGNDLDVKLHALMTRLFDAHGFGSVRATKLFLKWVEEYNPDMVWLHNIHGYYINIELLFKWLKSKPLIEKRWTLHDCWAFTGHCSHFTFVNCNKWREECNRCAQRKEYPKAIGVDYSKRNFRKKKISFTGVENMIIITPSIWLQKLVKHSYLREYKVEVVNNTIDTTIFKVTENSFKEDHNISGIMVLGVANVWNRRKGLYDFIELSKLLGEGYTIVLVGLTKRQAREIGTEIICIDKTNSKRELAQIYTAADVFLNLTYEDNYPTVNLEAQACGTPCITYRTGGSPESVGAENVVECGDIRTVAKMIREKCGDRIYENIV